MRIGHLLNADICYQLATLGHADTIAISDAGLTIPINCQRIDVALSRNVPSFLQVFLAVSQEMQIEKLTLAKEFSIENTHCHDKLLSYIKQLEKKRHRVITIDYLSHEQLKQQTTHCKAIIRSGECSPYANIIMHAGIIF